MNNVLSTAIIIGIVAIGTWFCRVIPFIVFAGKDEIPDMVNYLGKVLPPAIMVVLVLYCLRKAQFTGPYFGGAEIISIVVVTLLQMKKGNTILSVLGGTACYMMLIRTIFVL